MAKNRSTVFLGYEDEEITPKHAALLNSTVNKIGGQPDWPCADIKVPACPLCGLQRPLIVQLYAPLEQSQFHRTLFIFACLNATCSQNSKSWLCIRTQHLDMPQQVDTALPQGNAGKAHKKKKAKASANALKISWCSGADDWGDDGVGKAADGVEEMDTAADDELDGEEQGNGNEENGNVIALNDNSQQQRQRAGASLNNSDEEDDDEDESTSMENDLICGFGQLDMNSPLNGAAASVNANANDPNANCAAAVAGCIESNATTSCYAEIEGGENEVVLIETPKKPERDLIALLKYTSTAAAIGPLNKITEVTLKCYFIAVDLEQRQRLAEDDYEQYAGNLSDEHIRELYQEYKRQDELAHSPNSVAVPGVGGGGGAASGSGAGDDQETYEKSLPAHGDLIFHQFLSVIQQNPGQIIRYSRDTLPLLIAPLVEAVPKCPNCNGETICEIQLLSTLIPKLYLKQNNEAAPIEFGNVLVFTCLKSCWDTPDKMRYERVIVQAEK